MSNSGKLQTLTVGSRVFYPGHGVASVTGIEEREFGDSKQVFYTLELELDRVKLLLPAAKVSQAGVRDLVSASKARELMRTVKEDSEPAELKSDPAARRLRATRYSEALRSGSADRYTIVLRELLSRSRSGRLSPSEKQPLSQALAMFIGEMSAALNWSADEVRADLGSISGSPVPG